MQIDNVEKAKELVEKIRDAEQAVKTMNTSWIWVCVDGDDMSIGPKHATDESVTIPVSVLEGGLRLHIDKLKGEFEALDKRTDPVEAEAGS